jgi:SAM-dependent methyltransferase
MAERVKTGRRARIQALVLDALMRAVDDLRPQTVGRASGRVLELGFGTGRNLEHLGDGVVLLVGLDLLDTRGAPIVERRIQRARLPVERRLASASAELPFESASFDSVLATWTLCSIERPLEALSEVRRVLAPGGRLLFVEHGRSDRSGVARWQERLTPLWKRLMDGCHLDRRVDLLIEQAGFELEELQRFPYRGPALFASMYRGVARPR